MQLEHLEELSLAATRGPWTWNTYAHRVPELVGVGGEKGVYEYETEVLAAEHSGECGCRSACQLELNIRPEDAAFIAATGPDVVLALIQRIRELDAALPEAG